MLMLPRVGFLQGVVALNAILDGGTNKYLSIKWLLFLCSSCPLLRFLNETVAGSGRMIPVKYQDISATLVSFWTRIATQRANSGLDYI